MNDTNVAEEKREPNCREVCEEIINYLTRIDEVLDEIGGEYPGEAMAEAQNGNLGVLESQLADIRYRSQRLVERTISIVNRI